MRVTLVRPFIDTTMGVYPPIALMCLSAYLKSKNHHVEIVDTCAEYSVMANWDTRAAPVRRLLDQIKKSEPELIGLTLFSRELNEIAALCRLLKQTFPLARIVLGGAHPTALPRETMEQIPECDFLVRGEGEGILHELAECLAAKREPSTVKGICCRTEAGQIVQTPEAEVTADLDTLPFPDREGVMEHYRNRTYGSFVYGTPTDLMMTSRGCPFQCRFCFKVCTKYRGRSPQNVLSEVDWVVQHIKPASIQFMDDSFTISKPRAHEILDGMIQRRYGVKFKVRSRVNAVDEALLVKMKQAGVDTIVFGLESGAQTMLDAFDKRTTVEQNERACQMARKAGLNCLGDMILFYPGETRETLRETERMIRRAQPTAVKFYVLSPLPSTYVYKEAKANGSLVGDWSIGRQETPWVKLPGFGGLQEMERIAKSMQLRVWLRPSVALGVLSAYGKAFVSNPGLTVRMLFANLVKRRKY